MRQCTLALTMLGIGLVLFALSGATEEQKVFADDAKGTKGGAEPSATIKGRVVRLRPSGATFEIPQRWLDDATATNLHLTREQLERVKTAEGHYDREFAEVVNAAIPFSACAAHIEDPSKGWWSLRLRAYVVDMSAEQVQEKVIHQGAARAAHFSKEVSTAQSTDGKWRRATVTYSVWESDDSGATANVDVYAQPFKKQAAVLVFMYTNSHPRHVAPIPETLKSFALNSTETDDGKEKEGANAAAKTGSIVHSKPDRGLAAFLRADDTQIKVGRPIVLSYGLIALEARLVEGKLRPLKVVKPVAAADPKNRSWFVATAPDGKELSYRGQFVSFKAVRPEDVVGLWPKEFIGTISSDLNRAFDFKTPGKYRLQWHYEGGGLEDSWSGTIVSNEIQIEIVP